MWHGPDVRLRDHRAMTAAALAEAAARLSLLERYLREDPANLALLADACETAMAAGLPRRAAALADTAQEVDDVAADRRDAFQQLAAAGALRGGGAGNGNAGGAQHRKKRALHIDRPFPGIFATKCGLGLPKDGPA